MNAAGGTSSPSVCRPTLRPVVLFAALCLAVTAASAQGKKFGYKMIDLGTLPGKTMTMTEFGSLNQRGQVAGWSYFNHYVDDIPFVWEQGVMTALDCPVVAGPQQINDHGQIAGVFPDAQGTTHGFYFDADGFMVLPDPEGATGAWAFCLNNRGTIAGMARRPEFEYLFGYRPVVWENGQPKVLPTLDLGPGYDPAGAVYGINDADQLVGHSGGSIETVPVFAFNGHATLWEHGQPIDLGTLYDHLSSMAYAINNAGVVVGHSGVATGVPSRAFVWSKQAGMIELGMPPGWLSAMAYALNDRGEAVGSVSMVGDPQFGFASESGDPPPPWLPQLNHAVLWRNGQCIDLQELVAAESPWTLYSAVAVNARGQILTWAAKRNDPPDPSDPGKYYFVHLILLDPTK